MVIAYHAILSAYGFWLPNDPRGSWSEFVASWDLLVFGKATKVTTRHSVASRPHDVALRRQAKQALKYPAVRFGAGQLHSIGRGFEQAACEGSFAIAACAILPDHVHLIISRSGEPVERMVSRLKARATQALRVDGLHPFEGLSKSDGSIPSVWAVKYWKVFIDCNAHLHAAITYVEKNPTKHGLAAQMWWFVRK